ncbi:MAG TPA: FAD-dependent oxidoreductase [Phototrophicaceae bacterium]|jgi:hypothetical protein|nr:FAD-dependent oxidoreductase [Phototrophicaceae bacterium]
MTPATATHYADVIIIGGGLSGLVAALDLQAQDKSVIVLEKGSSIGGRLTTRKVGAGLADDGAQFFTVRSAEFQHMVDQWIDEKLVYLWSMGWSDGSLAGVTDDGHPRYAAHGGMNTIARRMAQDIKDIRTNITVESVQAIGSEWVIKDSAGIQYSSKALVLTPPVPQSLELLDAGEVRLTDADRQALERIQYAPCLTGLFLLEGNAPLPAPGAIQRRNAPISWIANNKQKGISEDATVITVQADDGYSAQIWNDPDPRILNALRTDLMVWLPEGYQILEEQLIRWRYSQPTVLHPDPCFKAAGLPSLVFAGDAFSQPRVEGAFLSGKAAASVIAGTPAK